MSKFLKVKKAQQMSCSSLYKIPLIVRISFLILFLLVLKAQAEQVNFKETKTSTVIDVLQTIERKTIKGIIVDLKGQPIIGGNIIEKGTSNGTVTDYDGNFTLNVKNNAVLKISYIGYLEQEIATSGKNTLNVVLLEDTKILDELIVIGYGSRQRKSITGAIDQVGSSVFEDRPISNSIQQ